MNVFIQEQRPTLRLIPIAVDPHEVPKSIEARQQRFSSWSEAVAYCDARKILIFNDIEARANAAAEAPRAA